MEGLAGEKAATVADAIADLRMRRSEFQAEEAGPGSDATAADGKATKKGVRQKKPTEQAGETAPKLAAGTDPAEVA